MDEYSPPDQATPMPRSTLAGYRYTRRILADGALDVLLLHSLLIFLFIQGQTAKKVPETTQSYRLAYSLTIPVETILQTEAV
jgi:hypothetical protein